MCSSITDDTLSNLFSQWVQSKLSSIVENVQTTDNACKHLTSQFEKDQLSTSEWMNTMHGNALELRKQNIGLSVRLKSSEENNSELSRMIESLEEKNAALSRKTTSLHSTFKLLEEQNSFLTTTVELLQQQHLITSEKMRAFEVSLEVGLARKNAASNTQSHKTIAGTSVAQSKTRERSSSSVVKDVVVNERAKVPQNIHIPNTCEAIDGQNMTEDGQSVMKKLSDDLIFEFLESAKKK